MGLKLGAMWVRKFWVSELGSQKDSWGGIWRGGLPGFSMEWLPFEGW